MENNFNIVAASVSDRGLSEKRPENEDSFLVLAEKGVYAVADGVGGAQAGDVASQMAVEILGEAFINQLPDIDAEDVMRAAIERANSAIFQMANDLPQLSSMATTIVALHVFGNIATIGHVGDSRLYRLDHNGNLLRETHDHSVVEEEVRAGRMTPEQAVNHPSKNVISRALGAEQGVEIDLKTIMVEPGTTFLLCSDGITRHIDDAEIGGLLEEGDPSDICEQMKEICYARGAEDNLTAIVVRVATQSAQDSTGAAAASSNGHSVPSFASEAAEAEEQTVASSRSPFESPAAEDEMEFATGETAAIDELDDQSYLMEENDSLDDDPTTDLSDYASSSVIVPAQTVAAAADPKPAAYAPASVAPRATVQTFDSEPPARGSSSFLSAFLFLLIGALLGAGAHYLWIGQPQAEPVAETPVLQEKSNNIPLTAFEEGRRLVDKDPQAYLNANAASARDADDYFLLGRASMLTGRYWEAKRSFIAARDKLAEADPKDAKTLATEISMALAIIESPQATETFTKDVATSNAPSAANSNSNNVAANSTSNSSFPNTSTQPR